MHMNTYSHEIAQAIDAHLREHEWKYQFHQDAGLFVFGLNVPGKARHLMYHIIVTDQGFTVVAQYPMGADAGNQAEMDNMARFLTRANYGLRVGNFEMDLDDGEIRYKVHCSCRGITVSDEMIFESIHCPSAMFSKYEAGLMGILFGGMSDKEAIRKSERSVGGLHALLERLERDLAKKEEHNDGSEQKVQVSFGEFLRMMAEKAADDTGAEKQDEYEDIDEE